MVKSIKNAYRRVIVGIDLILFAYFLFIFSMQFTLVQTKVAQVITTALSAQLDTEISLKKFRAEFFNRVVVNDLFVADLNGDTLLYTKEIDLGFDPLQLIRLNLKIQSACLTDPYINLYKEEGDSTLNMQFLIDYFSVDSDPNDTTSLSFSLNHLEFINGKTRFNNFNKERKEGGFDPFHLSIRELNIYLNEISVISNVVSAEFCKISLRESDFSIEDLTTEFIIGEQLIEFRDLNLKTEYSDIHGHFAMTTDNWNDYSEFTEKVHLFARILPSNLSTVDLSYFLPQIKGTNNIPHLSGTVNGQINNLKGRNVKASLAKHSRVNLNFEIKGLPKFEETYFYLDIKELVSSKRGIETIKIPPYGPNNHIRLPDNFSHLGQMVYTGRISGFPNDLVINGQFLSSIGSVRCDLSICNDSVFSYNGFVKTEKFDAGKFFSVEKALGTVTLDAFIQGSGLDKSSIDASIDGTIKEMKLNNYTYTNTSIAGKFKKERFEGEIKIDDPYVKLDFIGSIDLSDEEMDFNFKADIENLYPRIVLGIDHIDSSSRISSFVNIDIVSKDIDNVDGKFSMLNTSFEGTKDTIQSDSFTFTSIRGKGAKSLSVESDVFDFNLKGKYDLLDGLKTFKLVLSTYLPNVMKEKVEIDKNFTFDLKIKDYRLIEKLVSPGISFDSATTASGSFNSSMNDLSFNAFILGFKQGKVSIDTSSVQLYSENDELKLISRFSHYAIGQSTKERIIEVSASTSNNRILTKLNSYGQGPFSSDLTLNTYIFDHNTFTSSFENSSFSMDDEKWDFLDSNVVTIDSTNWDFKELGIQQEEQEIKLSGRISHHKEDKLSLIMRDFDMDVFKPFLENAKLSFDGILNGSASFRNLYNDIMFESNLSFKGLEFNEIKLGSGHVKSTWDDPSKTLFLDGSLLYNETARFTLTGDYNVERENPLNIHVLLHELPLAVLEPFTQNILSDFSGFGSGMFQLGGSLQSPELNGVFYLNKAKAKVDYTKVSYSIRNARDVNRPIPVKFTPDSIIIPEFLLIDEFEQTGKGSVVFDHQRFKKFDTDLKIGVNNVHMMNTTSKNNELYYGKAFVTGNISIWAEKGYSKIDMDIRTEKGTIFNLPIDESSEIIENQFIVFEKREKEELKEEEKEEEEPLNVDLNLKLSATPEAVARIVFDEVTGDVIETRGSGDLELKYTPKGGLNLLGEYVISSGSYVFTLQTVVNKKFIIENGSSIKWTGDPYKGIMNITTIYKLRARLADILLEIDDVNYSKNIPIELKLIMTESVESPIIGFDVYLPEARESTRGQLQAELSSENCLNQQVFSLLILGSFTPCQAREDNTATTNVGKSTAYEAMSNQLSSWLSNISDDVDIGVSYKPEIEGETYSSEQVEVAMSTQLFNDRLILDGNVGYGNQQQNTNQNTRDWAGEFTVEYKINPDGKLRVKAFNKVNDRYVLENDALYIQGVGLSYGKDFGSIMGRSIRRQQREEWKKSQ